MISVAPLSSHATAGSDGRHIDLKPDRNGRQAVREPAHRTPQRYGQRRNASREQLGGDFACSQPTGDAESYFGCRVRPPGRCCSCSGRALRPVSPGSDLIHPASMRVSRPAKLRDGSAGQRLVQRHLGIFLTLGEPLGVGWPLSRQPVDREDQKNHHGADREAGAEVQQGVARVRVFALVAA